MVAGGFEDMPEEWVNEHPLKDMSKKKDGVRREARTEFRIVSQFPVSGLTLVKARPITGRRHQIRRHLANAKMPIIGDTMHGKGKINRVWREKGLERLFLHAKRIRFLHPFREDVVVDKEIELADDLLRFLHDLPEIVDGRISISDLN